MNTKVVLGVVLCLFVSVLGAAYFTRPTTLTPAPTPVVEAPTPTTSTSTTPTPTPIPTASRYTMAKVATHNSGASCWTAINGNVYDVTNWINQHPGGPQAILSLCGKDGSDAFNGQHGGQPRPAAELASFLLGPLSN